MAENNQQRLKDIMKYAEHLKHARQCTDDKCSMDLCSKMKRAIAHVRCCRNRKTSLCQLCVQTMILCVFHAKSCYNDTCQMLFCSQIRYKLKQCRLRRTRSRHPYHRTRPTTSNLSSQGTPGLSSQGTPGLSSQGTPVLQQALEATLVAWKPGRKINVDV